MTLKQKTPMKRSPMVRTSSLQAKPKEPRRKKCKVCETLFIPMSSASKVCGTRCAIQHVALEKQRKEKRERRAGLEKLKRRADYMKEAQNAFNAYIRERDKGRLCISSGVPLTLAAVGGGYDCGHYRSVGSAPHLRFDERNAHGQTKKENRYLAGNATAYRVGLIARIGLAAVEELEADNTPRRWSVDDLKAIKAHYRAKLRELKKEAE